MTDIRRQILVASAAAPALPAIQACRTATVKDVPSEAARLLSLDVDASLQLILIVPAPDFARLVDLDAARSPGRWAAVVLDGNRDDTTDPPLDPRIIGYRVSPPTDRELQYLVQRGWDTLDTWARDARAAELRAAELAETMSDLASLVRIGQALSQEKDQEKLLRIILSTSKQITGADAGSISLVEPDGAGGRRLRFKYSHTFSKDLPFEEQVMPMETRSLAGYVAITGEVLNIPDVYALDSALPYRFNPSYDRSFDYRTRSMLAVPMRNHVDDVIGVIQLINCKEVTHPATGREAFETRLSTPEDFRDRVVAFPALYESLMQAVASQAAIAIENNRMIEQIRTQFEQFVRASVAAIESRDPPTSGHSFRVTQMCLNLARAANRVTHGPLAAVEFPDHALRELELAGLLHDFGKVYIEPAVFLKARRLYPADHAYLMLRLEFLYRSLELQEARVAARSGQSDPAHAARLEAILSIRESIRKLDEPGEIPDRVGIIREIRERLGDHTVTDLAGNQIPLLTDAEAENLAIARGTLNAPERRIIESHVTYTSAFVEKIPWPAEFASIPRITRAHHERMDGTGYPDGLAASQIAAQARIMAIADVYDALAAADRPYKKAVPRDKVLAILRQEAATGKLDADLVELFIREQSYLLPADTGPAARDTEPRPDNTGGTT